MELALLCSENAYKIDDSTVYGKVAVTNKPSSTAFRSFGVIQALYITETGVCLCVCVYVCERVCVSACVDDSGIHLLDFKQSC